MGIREVLVLAVLAASPLWSAPAVQIVADVPYLASDRAEKLDLYLPAAHAATPAIVWIHGGGWISGTKKEARAREICTTLAAAGYVAASIDYHLGRGSWPQSLLDAKNAVRFLRRNAAKYGIDPAGIAVAGGSAGGHLALMVGFTSADPRLCPAAPYPGISDAVRCVVDLYGPADLTGSAQSAPDGLTSATAKLVGSSLTVFGAGTRESPLLRDASPVYRVTRASPPVLILHGRADTTVDCRQSEELDHVLTTEGVTHEIVLIDGIGHTFDLERWGRRTLPQDLRPKVLAFLAAHLGPPAKTASE